MALRVGILSAAHLHIWSYAHVLRANPRAELVGLWDDSEKAVIARSPRRGNLTGEPTHGQESSQVPSLESLAEQAGCKPFDNIDELLDAVDAVVITSENSRHAELAERAASKGKHILCEKPLAISTEEGERMIRTADQAGVKLMTAFPCRFSPAYSQLKNKVAAGDIGEIRAICATNHGRCPFGWFVEKEKSGGGAMIDHVVHVADLFHDLLGLDPETVFAQTGNNFHRQDWEDTAMLTLQYAGGIFATLDSSWSRPSDYKTWGDVTMNVVGDKGVLEMNMFGQAIDAYANEHRQAGYGSNADALMVDAFLTCIEKNTAPPVTALDGLRSARVAFAGYRSVESGGPVAYSG